MWVRPQRLSQKFFRDSKLCTIGEGTTEIQKLVTEKIF
jgi:alkylation response protein AidB-like acyl-CoA dehydrogenase